MTARGVNMMPWVELIREWRAAAIGSQEWAVLGAALAWRLENEADGEAVADGQGLVLYSTGDGIVRSMAILSAEALDRHAILDAPAPGPQAPPAVAEAAVDGEEGEEEDIEASDPSPEELEAGGIEHEYDNEEPPWPCPTPLIPAPDSDGARAAEAGLVAGEEVGRG